MLSSKVNELGLETPPVAPPPGGATFGAGAETQRWHLRCEHPGKRPFSASKRGGGRQLKAPSAHNLRLSNILTFIRIVIVHKRVKKVNLYVNLLIGNWYSLEKASDQLIRGGIAVGSAKIV